LAVHVQATDQLRAVIASAMTSPQLELGEIADTRSRSSAGTAKALDDLEIFIGEVDGSEAAEGGTIDGTEAIEALNALRAAFAQSQSAWQPIETAPRDNPDGYPDEAPATAKPNAAGLTPTKAAHALKQAGPYVAAPALQSAPAPAVGAWRAMVLAWLAGAGSGALVTLLVLCQLRSP
jgi:hypothetical protein